MEFLLMFFPALMFSIQSSALKIQGYKCENTKGSDALFSTLYLALTALLALPLAFQGGINPSTLIYGGLFGLSFVLFISLYKKALHEGPMSYTVFIFSMSMIIPVVGSMIVYGDSLKIFHIIGFLIMLVAIYFINFSSQRNKKLKFSKKWLLLCLLGALFNGGVLFVSKVYPAQVEAPNYFQFLFFGFLVAAIISFFPFASRETRESLTGFKVNKWFLILMVVIAVTNILGNGSLSLLSAKFDASILFPVNNGSSMMFSILISRFFFKEELNKLGWLGMILGVISIVVFNIGG